MKVSFYDINWETDDQEIDISEPIILEVDDDVDIEQEGAEILSNETGYLVNSFMFEIL